MILYTWCCSCELLKNTEIIVTVVRKMRHEKLVNIIRILTMLSFFLDQVTGTLNPKPYIVHTKPHP